MKKVSFVAFIAVMVLLSGCGNGVKSLSVNGHINNGFAVGDIIEVKKGKPLLFGDTPKSLVKMHQDIKDTGKLEFNEHLALRAGGDESIGDLVQVMKIENVNNEKYIQLKFLNGKDKDKKWWTEYKNLEKEGQKLNKDI